MEYWAMQMPWLVDAYLGYHSHDLGDNFPSLDDAAPLLHLPSGTLSGIELVDLFGTPLHSNSSTTPSHI